MDDLLKQIMDQTGLGEDAANGVLGLVMSFLKDKLPGPIADQIETVLSGGSVEDIAEAAGGAGGLGGILNSLKGLFGGKN